METSGELPVEMMQILQLTAESVAGVGPEHVATVCHHDPALILGFIRTCEEQVISWQESLDEAREAADVDEALACQQELLSREDTARLLRMALTQLSHPSPR